MAGNRHIFKTAQNLCLKSIFDTPKPFPVAFPYKWPVLVHASDFPKINKQHLASVCHVSLAKWPQAGH